MVALAVPLILVLSGCASGNEGAAGPAVGAEVTTTPAATVSEESPVTTAVPTGDRLVVNVVGRRPHDAGAFTQGLEFDDGRLFESRGLYAVDESTTLTRINPEDGSTIEEVGRPQGEPDYFAEGLTIVDDRIIQITWREQIARVYDADTLEQVDSFTYEGEGWGLCDQPDRLIMSDGTPTLTQRDRDTFEVLGTVTVTLDGQPVQRINELECVGGVVWANIWQTDTIMVIDPDTGEVQSVVDASGLLTPEERASADVLNGIAYDPQTDTWLLTGKLWPWMFEVTFECVEGCDSPAVTPSHYFRPPGPRPQSV